MNLPTLLLVVAGVIAVVEIVQSEGRALLAWSVLLVCIVLVWGRL